MSPTWQIILAVFLAGCLGGLTNAVIVGELGLPHTDPEARVFRPGWVGNVLVGGVAGLVFWGVNGPMAAFVIVGAPGSEVAPAALHISELFGALLTGIGGGKLLTAAADKRLDEKEKAALVQAKDSLAGSLEALSKEMRE